MMILDALVRASIGGALGVAVAWALCYLFPRLPASARSVLWWCAAAKFVLALVWVAPVRVPVLPIERTVPSSVPRSGAPEVVSSDADLPSLAIAAPRPPVGDRLGWADLVVGGWSLLAGLAVALGAATWRRAAAGAKRSVPAWPRIQEMASTLSSVIGLPRVPDVRVSAEAGTPLVVGLFRPIVVLPATRLASWSSCEIEMAVAHELSHIKRRDLWFGCVPALAERLFFFHPGAHVAARQYTLWREAACDDMVIRAIGASPQAYGRFLVGLGIAVSDAAMAPAGASRSFFMLKRRLNMLNQHQAGSRSSKWAIAIAIGIAMAAVMPLQLVARPSAEASGLQDVTVPQPAWPLVAPNGRPGPTVPPALAKTESRPGLVLTRPLRVEPIIVAQRGDVDVVINPAPQAPVIPTATGSVAGTVIDQTGAVIPGAQVGLAFDGTERSARSGPDGIYRFMNVRSGPVRLSFSLDGFRTTVYTNFEVRSGAEVTADTLLELGGFVRQANAVIPDLSKFPAEASMLDQASRSGEPATYFELANRYYQEERFRDSERMVTRAVELIHARNPIRPLRFARPMLPVPERPAGNLPVPIRVGGDNRAPTQIRDVAPIYPSAARGSQGGGATSSGNVLVEAIISRAGTVEAARVIKSDQIFDEAALTAVKQWLFTPALLNGGPMEVPWSRA